MMVASVSFEKAKSASNFWIAEQPEKVGDAVFEVVLVLRWREIVRLWTRFDGLRVPTCCGAHFNRLGFLFPDLAVVGMVEKWEKKKMQLYLLKSLEETLKKNIGTVLIYTRLPRKHVPPKRIRL